METYELQQLSVYDWDLDAILCGYAPEKPARLVTVCRGTYEDCRRAWPKFDGSQDYDPGLPDSGPCSSQSRSRAVWHRIVRVDGAD